MQQQEGFTLLELIVYVGILAVSAALLTGILSIVLKVQNRESAANEVTSQLNFVMQNINRLARESSNIEIATSTATSTLKLRMKDSAKDPTCISLVNGVIKLAEGPDPSNKQNCVSQTSDLTNDRVVVDTLNFTKFSQYPGHDTVSVDIQMTYNSQNPQQQLTRELRSAIARVSAATFDSNLLPGSASYTIGQSGSAWYDAFISNLLYLGRLSDDPTASQEGAIYYNTTSNAFRGYKPSGWSNLGTDATPSGAVMYFNLSNCPSGWSELTSARGRYLVGLPSGGTLAGTTGTALSNLEDRAVGQHNHDITDPTHSHQRWASDSTGTRGFPYGPGSGWFDLAYEQNIPYSYTNWGIDFSTTGITINATGSVSGTNAPYMQLLVCQKD